MFQFKNLLKQEEDKVKYLEKQLQRETTERRIAEVKLSELRRSSAACTGAVVAAGQPRGTAAGSGGKNSMSAHGILSPPWKHRRKSDPLHSPLHKKHNPPMAALASRSAKTTAAHADKEPNNMQHVDGGIATTDSSNNYLSSRQQGSCSQGTDRQSKACTDSENRDNSSIEKQQCQAPVSDSNVQQTISGSQHQNTDRPVVLHDPTCQIAIDLLQDISQLTAELSQQLDDFGKSYYYQQTPTSLCNDWEKLKAIICETIEASAGARASHRSYFAGIQLLIMTVVDMIAHRRSDYCENITSTTSNSRNGMSHYEGGGETAQTIKEDKNNLTPIDQNDENDSSQSINPSRRKSSKATEEQRIFGLHVLNLLIVLERLVRLSSTARSCLITGLLMSSSSHSSSGSMDQQHLNSKAAANNQNSSHANQKRNRVSDIRDHGSSAPFVNAFHRNKRRRIFFMSGDSNDVAHPYGNRFQLQSSSYHTESLSLFFCWMKCLLFDCNESCVMATGENVTKETVRSTRPCHPSMHCLESFILLTLLRLISTLICESDLLSDEMCLKNLTFNSSHGTKGLPAYDSGNLGEELLASLICSFRSERFKDKTSDAENHSPDSSKRGTHNALLFVDLMCFVLGRQHGQDAPGTSIGKCIPDLQMKCSIFQLYRKILSSACGLAFSHLTMTSDNATVKGECMLLTLHELELCLRFLKQSTYAQSKSYTAPSIALQVGYTDVVKLTLHIVDMIVAYLQVDPLQCATLLHRKYQVSRESKLSWCRNSNDRSENYAQERSGVATLVDCLGYSVSTLLSVSSQGGYMHKMNVEFAHHLGLLIDSETLLFSLILMHVQRLDQSFLHEANHMSSLLHIIGDAKSSFCSSCCLLAQFSDFCPFISNTSRSVAQCLLEEIQLDVEDAEHS